MLATKARSIDKKELYKRKIKRALFILSFLAVPIVSTIVFYFYVNLSSILMAFDVPAGEKIIYNFKVIIEQFSKSTSVLSEALRNTMIFFAVNLLILLPAGFAFSYFMFRKIKFYPFFRVVFFLPSIISSTIMVSVFRKMTAVDGPILTIANKLFQLEQVPELLGNSEYAIWTIVAYIIWTGFGSNILLISGAMARLPQDVLEYARLDGVSALREMVSIISPMIWPTITMMIITIFSALFTASGPIYLFTQGDFGTYTISYYIFEMVYLRGPGQYPLASAVGLFFTLVGLPIILGVRFILEKSVATVEY